MTNFGNVLITGGTGSWGRALTQMLLQNSGADSIIIFSRNECNQVEMAREFTDSRVKFIIGDVRDHDALTAACSGVDTIFHLAALKHVPVCEINIDECIKSNILGTSNVVTVAKESSTVKLVVYVSTDKAIEPNNVYGMSKAIGERLIAQANVGSDIKFVSIRAGNVLGTNGSVVPLFMNSIKERNEMTVTSFEMTRFFITVREAINLLLIAAEHSYGGEIFVIRMPSFKIVDLALLLKERFGNSDTVIKEIGLRPGEKIHELLVSKHEAKHTYYFEDSHFIILPDNDIEGIYKHYESLGLNKYDKSEYSSNETLLTGDKLAELLEI